MNLPFSPQKRKKKLFGGERKDLKILLELKSIWYPLWNEFEKMGEAALFSCSCNSCQLYNINNNRKLKEKKAPNIIMWKIHKGVILFMTII